MSMGSIQQILTTWNELSKTQFQDESYFRTLGVVDKQQFTKMQGIARSIATGEAVPQYCSTEQKVLFQIDGRTVALFKPGSYRLDIELAVGTIIKQMGAECVCPAMAMAFNFDTLDPVAGNRFETTGMFGRCSFASEYHPNGYSTYYVAEPCESAGKKTKSFQTKGILPGILNFCIEDKKTTFNQFSMAVVTGAAIGMRDFKDLKAGFIFDLEEAMAANPLDPEQIHPHLHMPILKEESATKLLPVEVLEEIRSHVLKWDVQELVSYAKTREFLFRQIELEGEIGQPKYKKGSRTIRMTEHEAEYFSEISGREPEFFQNISIDTNLLFSDQQCAAFEQRLDRLQRFFINIGDDPSKWPKTNLWGLVHIIDPTYRNYCASICGMRARLLSNAEEFSAGEIRFRSLDANPQMFKEALVQNAGRMPLKISKDSLASGAEATEEGETAFFDPGEFCENRIQVLQEAN